MDSMPAKCSIMSKNGLKNRENSAPLAKKASKPLEMLDYSTKDLRE